MTDNSKNDPRYTYTLSFYPLGKDIATVEIFTLFSNKKPSDAYLRLAEIADDHGYSVRKMHFTFEQTVNEEEPQ